MTDLKDSVHPSVDVLRTFSMGQLSAAQAGPIQEHLSQCAACRQALADVGSETFSQGGAPRQPAPDSQATVAPADTPRANPLPATEDGTTSAESSASSEWISLPRELREHPRYRILSLLGTGGMGAVYKAEHRLMGRVVAIKVMIKALVGSDAGVERFRREVKAAARLSHHNIVAAYDAEQAGDVHFLVMEFVEGTDLAHWLAEHRKMPVAEACDYARQCATGLQHAHENGMIHRDIKPHNLMRTKDGTIKILDFGLARLVAEAGTAHGSVTGQGTLLGTIDYLAPEQADDARHADIRSDIYSLGCTLYHLLSGRPPFPQGTMVQKIMAHTERQPHSLQELRPDLPEGLARVVKRMMAKHPDKRYQVPAEVCAALQPFARVTPVLAPAPAKPAERHSKPVERPVKRIQDEHTQFLDELRRKKVDRDKPPAKSTVIKSKSMFWPIAIAVSVLLLFILLAVVGINSLRPATGTLVIQTDDADVVVAIAQRGKRLQVIDTKTINQVELAPGDYDLEFAAPALNLALSPNRVNIRGGRQSVATVVRQPGPEMPPAPPQNLPQSRGLEVRRDFFAGSSNLPAHIYRVSFSPDGRYFVAGSDADFVRVYNGQTGLLVSQFAPKSEKLGWSGGHFSTDGAKVVSWGNKSKAVYVWDTATGAQLHKLDGHKQAENYASFSPDGKRIISGGADKTLRIWDAIKGTQMHVLEGHTDMCLGFFSPDGKWIISYSDDKTVRGWDAATGKPVWTQPRQTLSRLWIRSQRGPTETEVDNVFSPEGKRLFSLGEDGSVRLWDVATGKPAGTFAKPSPAQGVLFLQDGRRLVTWHADNWLHCWDLASGKAVHTLFLGQDVLDVSDYVAVSPSGRLLLTGHRGATVRVRDLATGRELARYPIAPALHSRSLAVSPDGIFAAAGSHRGWVFLWRLPPVPPGEVSEIRQLKGHTAQVTDLAISTDGQTLVSASGDKTVRLWDLVQGKERGLLKHQSGLLSVAVSRDSKKGASGDWEGVVKVWDLASGKDEKSPGRHELQARGLAFSPDGSTLFSGGGQIVRAWDLASGKLLQEVPSTNTRSLTLSPDGTVLAVGTFGGTVKLWDVMAKKELRTLQADREAVNALAFTPDGKELFTAGVEGVLKRWEIASGKQLTTWVSQGRPVETLALSPNGKILISGEGDWKLPAVPGRIVVWDVATFRIVHTLPISGGCVYTAAFAPDGKTFATGEFSGTVRLWRVPDDSLRAHLRTNAVAMARQKRWKEAAADFDELIKLDPRHDFTSLQAAVLMLLCDDRPGYRRVCQHMLDEFRNTNSAVEAERTAQAWLIGDEAHADLGPAVQLADFAVQQGKRHGYYAYFLFTRGLADYRQGRSAAALEWFAQSRRANAAFQNPIAVLDAKNNLFEAMALHQLGRGTEAAQLLKSTTAVVNETIRATNDPLHVDWLMCVVAIKEAEKTLKGPPGQQK